MTIQWTRLSVLKCHQLILTCNHIREHIKFLLHQRNIEILTTNSVPSWSHVIVTGGVPFTVALRWRISPSSTSVSTIVWTNSGGWNLIEISGNCGCSSTGNCKWLASSVISWVIWMVVTSSGCSGCSSTGLCGPWTPSHKNVDKDSYFHIIGMTTLFQGRCLLCRLRTGVEEGEEIGTVCTPCLILISSRCNHHYIFFNQYEELFSMGRKLLRFILITPFFNITIWKQHLIDKENFDSNTST